jgi:hypothetical protein
MGTSPRLKRIVVRIALPFEAPNLIVMGGTGPGGYLWGARARRPGTNPGVGELPSSLTFGRGSLSVLPL